MYFDSLSGALQMGGHGGFVWSAYLITVVVVSCLIILPKRKEKQIILALQGALNRQHRD
jgi:heme exporter protein D